MASFFSSYSLPRPLSKLYNDTKHVGDVVSEPDKSEELPELSALHRKFRIQKDRLIAWGLEWSDNSASQGDIEESVARAGLTDTVTSVLNTIKEIYEEAERLQTAETPGKEKQVARPSPDATWAASTRVRYEALTRDLCDSIDILYDLSRSRRAMQKGALPLESDIIKSSFYTQTTNTNNSEATLIPDAASTTASLRTGLPPKLDLSSLLIPEEEPPPYDSVQAFQARATTHVIARYRQSHSSTNPWKTDGSKMIEAPVLIEYAYFDSCYSMTEVLPPLDRLEELLAGLVRLQTDSKRLSTFTCIGYFEDLKHSRYGLVYELPKSVYSGPADVHKSVSDLKPVTLLSLLQATSNKTVGLSPPPLEDRFRLAFRMAQTFNRLHQDGLVHKDLNSANVLIFKKNKPLAHAGGIGAADYALRYPRVGSFSVFSEFAIEIEPAQMAFNIYRHPNDPRTTGDFSRAYAPQFDMYSLGLILLEVGLWLPLGDLFKPKYSLNQFKTRLEEMWIRKLASKCGTAYMQAVRECFMTADKMAVGAETPEAIAQIYTRVLVRLQRCCLLDEEESPNEDEDANTHLSAPPAPVKVSPRLKSRKRVVHGQESSDSKRAFPENLVKQLNVEKGLSDFRKRSPPSYVSAAKLAPSSPGLHPQNSANIDFGLSNTPTLVSDDANDWVIQRPATRALSHEGFKELSTLYKEQVVDAVYVIQRAWRSSRIEKQEKLSFKEFKRRVTIIQRYWRLHRALRSTSIHASTRSETQQSPESRLHHSAEKPEIRVHREIEVVEQSDIKIQMHQKPPKPKLWVHPTKFSQSITDEWHDTMLPRLERLIERALKDSPETVSIDLLAVGETSATAKPTVFVTCSSTARVKAVLARKFSYDKTIFDLKVRKGKVRRSKLARKHRYRQPHRSMAQNDEYPDLNPLYQQRPLCGASIGAFINEEHLPPVSFGGVVMVDGEPYGMSVHHLLDPPSDDESELEEEPSPEDVTRSSAQGDNNPWLAGMASQPSLQLPPTPRPFELSDFEDSDSDEGDFDSLDFDLSDEDESDKESVVCTEGDIEGVEVGDGDEIYITQPAFDDVGDGFFPCEEDAPEEHLDSHTLGNVHASSGIRRWTRDGICHEIDWALLKLKDHRLQPFNLVQGGKRYNAGEADAPKFCPRLVEPIARKWFPSDEDEYPNQVAAADSLGNLAVHCFGRTSGLKGGMVGSAMSSLRIYRRRTFSRSWHVAGGFGVGGDSGAWVIDNVQGRVCGHVLAWCEKNRIAYICPMQVLLEDMKRQLGARHIYLPGAEEDHPQTLGLPPPAQEQRQQQQQPAMPEAQVRALRLQAEALNLGNGGYLADEKTGDMGSDEKAGGLGLDAGTAEAVSFDLPDIAELRLGGVEGSGDVNVNVKEVRVPSTGTHRSLGSPVGMATFGEGRRQAAR